MNDDKSTNHARAIRRFSFLKKLKSAREVCSFFYSLNNRIATWKPDEYPIGKIDKMLHYFGMAAEVSPVELTRLDGFYRRVKASLNDRMGKEWTARFLAKHPFGKPVKTS